MVLSLEFAPNATYQPQGASARAALAKTYAG